ncbi:MAG TPA: ABC transporter substrate-binding protein, partial [Planctomycetota bacterium]|nr:ABC transporter substrate-binding protein [Planctomycetota bacterium]
AGLSALLAGRVAGAYQTRHFDPGAPRAPVAEFAEAYRSAYAREPTDAAALGYDAALAALASFEPGRDGAALLERLRALRELPGATGALSIGPSGSALGKPVVLARVDRAEGPAVLRRPAR